MRKGKRGVSIRRSLPEIYNPNFCCEGLKIIGSATVVSLIYRKTIESLFQPFFRLGFFFDIWSWFLELRELIYVKQSFKTCSVAWLRQYPTKEFSHTQLTL